MKYIDAEKLIAEIDRQEVGYNTDGKHTAEYNTCRKILDIITSLQQEQPEVDFEKEYKSYMKSRKDDLSGNAVTINMKDLAHYFWNKGLNARKEDIVI